MARSAVVGLSGIYGLPQAVQQGHFGLCVG